MTEPTEDVIDQSEVFKRFPANVEDLKADRNNPAIRLYGRRFYKDQTPVEYLSEFLLVFASAKKKNGDGSNQFSLKEESGQPPCYYPEDRVALKLFSFFSSSKLETRHHVHRQAYIEALDAVSKRISGTKEEREETIRLIQSLLGGFVGVAKNRTWVTHSFLPASTVLLSREISWEHNKALNNEITDWDSSLAYFKDNLRNFMSRGGELLFLQIVNFFSKLDATQLIVIFEREEYCHLKIRTNGLHERLEHGVRTILEESIGQIGGIVKLIEGTLEKYKINPHIKSTGLGWVSAASRTEAMLFAMEMDNICASNLGAIDKLELLQTLCSFQILRSLCFQARRIDETEGITPGFVGNYAWMVTDPDAKIGMPIRQMAESSFNQIDALLYRALRSSKLYDNGIPHTNKNLSNGDDNCFRHFRKFSKEIGLVIPRTGAGQRFTLHQGLLRFLVAALVFPGERVRLTTFYRRVFAHYGIALGGEQLAVALRWSGNESGGESYAVSSSTDWVEEALKQGGFLVELSDAVSMVQNPGKSGAEHNEFIY